MILIFGIALQAKYVECKDHELSSNWSSFRLQQRMVYFLLLVLCVTQKVWTIHKDSSYDILYGLDKV